MLVVILPDSPVQLVQPCTSSDYKVNVSSAERVLRVRDCYPSSGAVSDCCYVLVVDLVVLPFLGTAWGSTRLG